MTPEWPETDMRTRCRCGAELQYRHIVHEHGREREASNDLQAD